MRFFSKISSLFAKDFWWQMKSYKFNAIFSLFILFAYNKIFFEKLWEVYPSSIFVSMLTLVLFLLLNAACAILFWPKITKFLAILFTMLNAGVFYFMFVYHVAIDKVMLMNVLETDAQEVAGLLSWGMLWMFLVLAVVPSILIYKTKIIFATPKKMVLQKIALILGVFVISVAIIGMGYKETAQFLRNNKPIKYLLVPVNYVSAVISVSKKKLKTRHHELVKIGEDASLLPYWKNNGKPNLFVFVVGETARAANFSLNGYNQQTNEPLQPFMKDMLSYKKVYSCGTSTAISLPCIFSADGRDGRFGGGAESERRAGRLRAGGCLAECRRRQYARCHDCTDGHVLRPESGRVRAGAECESDRYGHSHADLPPSDGGGRKGEYSQLQLHGGISSHDACVRLCCGQGRYFQLHGFSG